MDIYHQGWKDKKLLIAYSRHYCLFLIAPPLSQYQWQSPHQSIEIQTSAKKPLSTHILEGNSVQKGLRDDEDAVKIETRNVPVLSLDEETNFIKKRERENIFTSRNSNYNQNR